MSEEEKKEFSPPLECSNCLGGITRDELICNCQFPPKLKKQPKITTVEKELPGELAPAIAIKNQTFPCTIDAQVWVKEWFNTLEKDPEIHKDESAMLGWFANAIMAGYDTARSDETNGA
jgi:hypothetical protein